MQVERKMQKQAQRQQKPIDGKKKSLTLYMKSEKRFEKEIFSQRKLLVFMKSSCSGGFQKCILLCDKSSLLQKLEQNLLQSILKRKKNLKTSSSFTMRKFSQ
jgi:hypothetical protein